MCQANEYINLFGSTIIKQLNFEIAIGSNYFFEIAKIQAFRILWKTISNTYGLPINNVHIIAIPTVRNKTIYDYNNNLIRSTSECMAAILGGANSVKNFNYDSGDLAVLHEFLEFLENDRENRPFLAMIYHVIANHYIKISKDSTAINYYNKSLSSNPKNQYLSAINYHTLADYYYDNSNYVLAGAYYDSTPVSYTHLTLPTILLV
mgnify:CR=1 FL=1